MSLKSPSTEAHTRIVMQAMPMCLPSQISTDKHELFLLPFTFK